MFKVLLCTIVLGALSWFPASAGEIEGKIISLNKDARELTLYGGETFDLTNAASVGALEVNQVVRVVFVSGTIDAQYVYVLQEASTVDEGEFFDGGEGNP